LNPVRAKTIVPRFIHGLYVLWLKVGWGVVLGAILVSVFFLAWQLANQQTRTDFEGTIVDRYADYAETQEGSRPAFRLMVESETHERFKVRVDPGVYESAKVGMRIKSKSGKIELIDSQRRNTRVR
jgi:hypothetical protein